MQNCNSPVLFLESSPLPHQQSDLYHYSHTFQRRLKPLCIALGAALLLGGMVVMPAYPADWGLYGGNGGQGGGGGQTSSGYGEGGSSGYAGGAGSGGDSSGGGSGGAGGSATASNVRSGSDGQAGSGTHGGGGGGGGGAGIWGLTQNYGYGGYGGTGGSGTASFSGSFDNVIVQAGNGGYPGGGGGRHTGGGGNGGGGAGVTAYATGNVTASNMSIISGDGTGGAAAGQGAQGGQARDINSAGWTGGGGGAAFVGDSGSRITINTTLFLTSNSGGVSFKADRLLANQIKITKASGALDFYVNKLEVASTWDPDWNLVSGANFNAKANYLFLTGSKRLFFELGSTNDEQVAYNKGNNLNADKISIGQLYISGGTLNDYGGYWDPDGNWKTFVGGGLVYATNDIIAEGTVTIDIKNDQTLTRIMTGVGNLVKNNTGTFTLTDNISTYSGTTTINGGKLALKGKSSLAASAVTVNSAGILDVSQITSGGGSVAGLSGSGKVFLGNKTLTINATGNTTFSGVIADGGIGGGSGGGLIKAGNNTLTLSGNNTYTGNTTINSGTLQLGSGGTAGSVNGNIVANGSLVFNRSDAYTFARVISGSGTLTQNGTGTLILTGSNTYTGNTTISRGTLQLGNGTTSGAIKGNIVNNSALVFKQNGNYTFASNISGSGSLSQSGSNNLTLSGTLTYSGATTVNSGSLTLNKSLNNGKYAGAITNKGTLTIASGADQILSGTLANTGTFVLNTANKTTTLSGNNSYASGTYNITAGTLLIKPGTASDLNFNAALAAGTATSTLSFDLGGKKLAFGNAVGAAFKGTIDIANATINLDLAANQKVLAGQSSTTLQLSKGGIAQLGSTSTSVQNLTFNGGTLDITAFGGKAGTAEVFTVTGTLAAIGNGTVMIDVRDLDSVTDKSASPVGTNFYDYNDDPRLHQVRLVIANSVDSNISTRLQLVDHTGQPFNNDVHTEAIGDSGVATFNYSASLVTTGDIGVYLGYGLESIEAKSGKQVTIDSTGSQATGANRKLEAQLTGSGGFIFKGDEDAYLGNANNNYTGATTVTGTTLTAITDNALGQTSNLTLASSATLHFDEFTQTVGGLSSDAGSAITLNDAASQLTVGVDDDADRTGAGTFAGTLTGAGALQKSGSGTLQLSGTTNYSGDTTITGGQLTISGSFGSSNNYAGKISNDGILLFAQDAEQTLSGEISGSGELRHTGSENLILTAANSYTGQTSIGSGSTLTVLGSGSLNLGNYGGAIANDGTLALNQSGDQILSGNITGSGNLSKIGSNTLTLSGTSNYGGTTTINGGTLSISKDANIGQSTNTLNNATLLLTGTSFGKAWTLVGTSNTIDDQGNSIAFTGALSGANAGFAKAGVGNLNLGGLNSYTGPTTINQGTLTVSGTLGHIATNNDNYSANIVNNATLVFAQDSYNQELSGVISGSGAFQQSGNNTLTLSQNNTFSGDITISAGTLKVTGTLGHDSSDNYGSRIANAGKLIFDQTTAQTLSGEVSGDGELHLASATQLTLTNQHSFSGKTFIEKPGSTLLVLGVLSAGDHQGDIDNAGQLTFTQEDDQKLSGVISGNGKLTLTNARELELAGSNTYQGSITVSDSQGKLLVSGLLGGGNYNGTIANSGALTFSQSAAQMIAGVIEGAGSLTKNGVGLLTLGGQNTYTGNTTIGNSGLLTVSGNLGADQSNTYDATIEIGNQAILTFAQDNAQTINGVIKGSGSLSKTGSGNLTLRGNNTFSGNISNDENGTLTIVGTLGHSGTSGNSAQNIVNDHLLVFAQTANQKLSGSLSGKGELQQTANTTLELAGNNIYTGKTTIAAGTLLVSGTLGYDSDSPALYQNTITNNSHLIFTQTAAQEIGGSITGTGDLTKNGTGVLTLSADNSYSGNTLVSNSMGVARLTLSGSLGHSASGNDYAHSFTNNGIVTFAQSADQKLSGVYSGSGTLIKNGDKTLTLANNSNVYSGAVYQVNAGTLSIVSTSGNLNFANELAAGTANAILSFDLGATANKLNFAASTKTVFTGMVEILNATLSLDAPNNAALINGTATTTLRLSANSLASLSNTSQTIQNLTFNGGMLDLTAFGGSGGAPAVLTVVGTLDAMGGGGTIKLNVGTLNNVDTGFAPVATTNFYDYYGSDMNNQVALVIAGRVHNSAVSKLTLVDENGAVIQDTAQRKEFYIDGTAPGNANGIAHFDYAAQLISTTSAAQPHPGIYLGYGLVDIEAYSGKVVTIDSSSSIETDDNQRVLNARLTGAGSFTFIDTGTGTGKPGRVGNVNNDYSGRTVIEDIALTAITDNSFGKTVELSLNNAALDLQENKQTVGALNGDAQSSIALNGGELTIGVSGDAARKGGGTFSGSLSGNGKLSKNGSDTLTLSGSTNSYSGDISVSQGKLVLNEAYLYSSQTRFSGNLANDGEVVFNQQNGQIISGVISGSGSLSKQGAGVLELAGNNTYSGSTSIATGASLTVSGTLGYQSGAMSDYGSAIHNEGTLTFNQYSDQTISGAIDGSGELNKLSENTLTLSGNNSYRGPTTIAAGKLILQGTLGHAGGSNLYAGQIVNDASLVVDQDVAQEFSGAISGSGALEKDGTGLLTLSGTNSFNGPIKINSGSPLTVSGTLGTNGTQNLYSGTISNAGSLTVDQNVAQTMSGLISGSGTLEKKGSGVLTLTVDNTYEGDTTISGGTLSFGGGGTTGKVVDASNIINNAAMVVNRSADWTYAGTISGTGSLTKLGDSTLTLIQASSYSGSTTINDGVLQIGSGNDSDTADIAASSNISISSSSTLLFNRTGDTSFGGPIVNNNTLSQIGSGKLTLSGNISGSGDVLLTGSGTLELSGNNSYTGKTAILGGNLIYASDDNLGDGVVAGMDTNSLENGTLTLTGSSYGKGWSIGGINTIDIGDQALVTMSGALIDVRRQQADGSYETYAGGFTMKGNGTLKLAGFLDYQGDVVLTGGTLELATASNERLNGTVTGTGNLHKTNTGAPDIGGLNIDGNLTIDQGQLLILGNNDQPNSVSGTISVNDTCMGSDPSNCPPLVMEDAVVLGLSLKDSTPHVPLLTAQKVEFIVNDNNLVPEQKIRSNGLFLNDTATSEVIDVIALQSDVPITGFEMEGLTHDPLSDDPTLRRVVRLLVGSDFIDAAEHPDFISAVAYLDTSAAGVPEGIIRIRGGLTWFAPEGKQHGTFTVDEDSSFTVNTTLPNRNANPNEDWDGSSLTKAGDGTLILNAENTYTGDTNVTGGTLQIGNGDSSGSLHPDSQVNLSGNSNLVINQNDQVDFPNNITGEGNFAHRGTGEVILSGDNDYSGYTIVENGTLTFASDDNIGNGINTMSNATLHLTGDSYDKDWVLNSEDNTFHTPGDVVFNGDLSNHQSGSANISGSITALPSPGGFTKTGEGDLTLNGNNTFTGDIAITEGGLIVTGNLGAGNYNGTIVNQTSLTMNQDTLQELNGTITGDGSLTKDGSGTLVLRGANDWAGDTIIKKGVLKLEGAGAIGKQNLQVHSGTTFDISAMNAQELSLNNRVLRLVLDNEQGDPHVTLLGTGKNLNLTDATLQFDMPLTFPQVLLDVGDMVVDITRTRLELSSSQTLQDLHSGDYVTLIRSDHPLLGSETINLEPVIVSYGFMDYIFHVAASSPEPGDLNVYYGNRRPNENTDSLVHAQSSRAAFLTSGMDHLLDVVDNWKYVAKGSTAPSPGQNATGFTSFASMQMIHNRTKVVGSRLKNTGASLIAGGAWDLMAGPGDLLVSLYAEGGTGSYDSYMTDADFADGDGNGENWFWGVGSFAKYTLTNGWYFDGSLRAGWSKVDYNGEESMSFMEYSSRTGYHGGHLGVGIEDRISESSIIDYYIKGIWMRQDSDSIIASSGEKIDFSVYDSLRSRLGIRYIHDTSQNMRWSVGIGWDHEFDGDVKIKVADMNVDYPNSLHGHSGFVQAGWQWAAENDWTIDVDATGTFGKRKGGSFNVMLRRTF